MLYALVTPAVMCMPSMSERIFLIIFVVDIVRHLKETRAIKKPSTLYTSSKYTVTIIFCVLPLMNTVYIM